MNCCNWESIQEFNSPGEYRRFCAWLESQIVAGMVERISVGYSNVDVGFGVDEKWFKCKDSGEVWRLIAPEPPSRGLWSVVELGNTRYTGTDHDIANNCANTKPDPE